MEEEGGKIGDDRTMGRWVGGNRSMRASKGRAEDSMMLRRVMKEASSWLVLYVIRFRKGQKATTGRMRRVGDDVNKAGRQTRQDRGVQGAQFDTE